MRKVVLSVLILMLAASILSAAVIEDKDRIKSAVAKSFDYADGSSTVVKIYQRQMDEYPCKPLFKYVDVMNQALRYKKAHFNEDVEIRFAMYTLSLATYFHYNDDDSDYGEMTSEAIPGKTGNILDMAVLLAKHQIKINFAAQTNITKDVEPLLSEPCITDSSRKVGDYLTFTYVRWGGESEQQMHAKFITANRILDDSGAVHSNVVYLASSNIDALYDNFFKSTQERAQTGVLILDNQGIYKAFNTYQSWIPQYFDNQKGFQDEVRAAHKAKTLNYSDQYFHTHFTPVLSVTEDDEFSPDSYSPAGPKESAWDLENNMFAKYMDEMVHSDRGERLFYANVYHYKTAWNDFFGWKMFKSLRGLYFGHKYDNSANCYITVMQNKDLEGLKDKKLKLDKKSPLVTKWVIETSTSPHRFSGDGGFLKGLSIISGNKALYYKADHKYKTHCKDVLFSYIKDGAPKYVVITGSTNLKRDDNANKANASVAILESKDDHALFDAFKGFIDSIVDSRK
ncbi:MAG: hypothetical protein J6U56_00075 [Spirochaetia bacterium]|nr:hypothetical protein [Spirochaetia bacterium]